NQTITASQGTSPYSFAITNGSLPQGLTLATNGALSGSPANAGQYQFTVTATDAAGATGARTYLLRICNASSLMPVVLPEAIVNAPYQQTVTLAGGGGPHTFTATGSLPPGLALSASGTLSGTPVTPGTYAFTIAATESTSCVTAASYVLTVGSGREPRDVAAQARSNVAILVRWVRPQRGETGFRIERSFDGGTTWGSINIVGADVTSHLDQGLTPQSLVHYRVVALYGAETATSSMAAAMTFPHGPTTVCLQPIGPYHPRAQQVSVAHDGTRWAAAWSDRRDGRLEDIYFQFLDDTTGAPVGSPVVVTRSDMQTRFPTLRWNGTHFGVLYTEGMRAPHGESASTASFALLDASGNLLRTGVRVHSYDKAGLINNNGEMPLVWDGGGWGTISLSGTAGGLSDLYYRRLALNGDVLTGPVQLTNTPHSEFDVTMAWNGSEYGVAWGTIEGTAYKLWFARMQTNGTLLGPPLLLDQSGPNAFVYAPSLVWSAGEWAVAWSFETNDEAILRLRRLRPDGTPKGAATRLSDDLTNPSQPPIDLFGTLLPKSGGGYFVFTVSLLTPSSMRDVARLEADASGNRAGSRVFLTSPNDSVSTLLPHAATDGTRFLAGFEQNASGQAENATIVLDANGNATSGPTAITTGHTDGTSGGVAVAMGANFGAIWIESNTDGNQLYAKFFDGIGNLVATRYPLVPSTTAAGRIAAVGVGHSFALAWRDTATGMIRFRRFDSAGNPLTAEHDIASGVQPAIAWNGEHYGVLWSSGGLRFQRVAAGGALVGPSVVVTGFGQQAFAHVQWVDRGWAIVWRGGDDLWFALLDRNGAFLVEPRQFTFTPTFEQNVQVAWSGDRLGVVWRDTRGGDPPGDEIWFTALRLDGTKAFSEVPIVSTPFGDGGPAIYWDLDRFRVVHWTVDGTREIAVQSDGTVLPGDRILHNRIAAMSIAFNGTSLGMLFNGLYDLTFQTSSCLADDTAPPCPSAIASFDGQRVRLTWPAVSDPQSGIGAYNVYRDGTLLAELRGDTLLFDDHGFVSGATHVYEVRAVNRALRESAGCTTRTVVAGVAVNPPSLAHGSVNAGYNAMLSGSGGTAPYTFAVTAGALPPGLALNATTGALTGVPVAAGLYTFTITVTDALARSGSRAYTIRICAGITLYPTILADGSPGNPYGQTVVAANATGGVNFTLSAGALPPGVTLDPTGWIHGTPAATGTSSFTVAATDSIGCAASRAYTIVIGAAGAARGLSATALSSSSIRLRWTDPQRNENGFRVERSTNLGASWTPLTIVGANATTFTDSGLTAATVYSYRVVATTPAGDAPPSNAGTATTFPASAAKTCMTQLSPYHAFARPTSVVRADSQWAMVWQDRQNGENDEIWFS
ncbi:MAG TPA: putative Ig domain-containing protein, partial [Thermoanaerobaculia bacterium]|nr:putative Ig domain-containing protein [Thermoanaerobaculia bacterium]